MDLMDDFINNKFVEITKRIIEEKDNNFFGIKLDKLDPILIAVLAYYMGKSDQLEGRE